MKRTFTLLTITLALFAAAPVNAGVSADDPEVLLMTAYATYAHVKWCHDIREGYAYQAISDAEVSRAQAVVRSVEAQSVKANAAIDTNRLWKSGLELASRNMEPRKVAQPGFAEVCRDVLRQLYELSPTPVYSIAKP